MESSKLHFSMTKISYVHGIPSPSKRPAFLPKASNMRYLPQKRYLNYGAWTEGELMLMLALEQIELEQGFYDDPLNIYGQARDMLVDTIFRGAHTGIGVGMPTGFVPEEIANTVNVIRHAKKLSTPAGLVVDAQFRPSINGGFDPNGPLIDEIDCVAKYPYPSSVPASALPHALSTKHHNRAQCREQNEHIRNLNKNYGDSAHQNLYAFVSNPNSEPNLVAVKYDKHQTFHDIIHDITNLGRINLLMWTRNGVMRHNFEKGDQPLQPEETIQVLRSGGINDGGLTIGIILAIVKVALAATVTLVQTFSAVKQQKIKNNAPDLGFPNWGPQDGDFRFVGGGNPTTGGQTPTPGTDNQNNNNSNKGKAIAVGAGVVAAGMLLLNSSSDEKK